jgi:hypothetical protein
MANSTVFSLPVSRETIARHPGPTCPVNTYRTERCAAETLVAVSKASPPGRRNPDFEARIFEEFCGRFGQVGVILY